MLLFATATLSAQEQFPWPVTPFNSTQEITGSFAEYRSTSTNGHFHNGTDIPKPDNSPVYPSKDGVVSTIGTTANYGTGSWVRINDIAYVHIEPNPALQIGDSVFASQTILGTILPGQGHVHFTNGFVGSEKNSIRANRDLTPYQDPWPPIIRFVRFFQNNSSREFPTNELSGLVDIMVKVDEQNGPPSARTSRLNNGTYKIGYKILSADTGTVVFDPGNNGLRFKFDNKPSNRFVNTVYYKPMSSTTSHTYQVTNNISSDNFWNTSAFPEDDYIVMVFTEDTRENTDTAYVAVRTVEADLEAPAQPAFSFIGETENGIGLSWFPNMETDLLGYRLFFSFDNLTWNNFRREDILTPAVTDTTIKQILNRDIYFKLVAVDSAPLPNASDESDIYGLSNGTFQHKALIVDGFDRIDGDWNQPSHDFGFTHGSAIFANGVSFDTAPNEAITDSLIQLGDYNAVIWILGDEADKLETFSKNEQTVIIDYLENGGNLFVSGSQIAWDLSSSDSATVEDLTFLNQYLKAEFVSAETALGNVSAVESSIFDGLNFEFGKTPYNVNSTNVIRPFGENTTAGLEFGESQVAAIQYDGTFGESAIPGKLIYLAFPFETISEEEIRVELLSRVFDFFFQITSVEENTITEQSTFPQEYVLLPNYPNPFNPTTKIQYHLPVASFVKFEIYNNLGQKVRVLKEGLVAAGRHSLTWNALDNKNNIAVPSGIYFIKFEAKSKTQDRTYKKSHKLLLLK